MYAMLIQLDDRVRAIWGVESGTVYDVLEDCTKKKQNLWWGEWISHTTDHAIDGWIDTIHLLTQKSLDNRGCSFAPSTLPDLWQVYKCIQSPICGVKWKKKYSAEDRVGFGIGTLQATCIKHSTNEPILTNELKTSSISQKYLHSYRHVIPVFMEWMLLLFCI